MLDLSPRTPIFKVVTPASGAAARRLTTATKVQDQLGIGAVNTTMIETLIDFESAAVVRYCGLARDAAGSVPTFGAETVRATWLVALDERSSRLLLPWRVPVTTLTLVEDTTTLVADTDYRLLPGSMIERVVDDTPVLWPCCKIVADYIAGWALPGSVPAELEGAFIDQVKMKYLMRGNNPNVKSEEVPEIYRVDYSLLGGSASSNVGKSGLLISLENALVAFKYGAAT